MKTELENDLWESLLKSVVIENSLKELEAYPPEKKLQKINLPPHYNIVMQKFIRHYQCRKQMRAILHPAKKNRFCYFNNYGYNFLSSAYIF